MFRIPLPLAKLMLQQDTGLLTGFCIAIPREKAETYKTDPNDGFRLCCRHELGWCWHAPGLGGSRPLVAQCFRLGQGHTSPAWPKLGRHTILLFHPMIRR